uniref:AsmC n=1 Tax=Lactiplantibacillus plantarum TaxID=1590 RepID=A0A1B3IR30_LACPN|nr:thioredoxin family protein [Lactiplantibacillus plantarum]AOF43522.1 AsmC [Lactiplantibacillus plantarum]
MKKITIAIIAIIAVALIGAYSWKKLTSVQAPLYQTVKAKKLQSDIKNKKNEIVYFYQKGCEGCEHSTPILNRFIRNKHVTIQAIDINADPSKDFILGTLGISSTPTVLFIRKGKITQRINQIFGYEDLTTKYNKFRGDF